MHLLCDDNQVERPFCKRLLDKLGTSLRTGCPRGCGVAMFALEDRKEHADFCALGVTKCLRCGQSVVRKDVKGAHRKACEGRPGMRRWPVRPRRKVVGEAVVLGVGDSAAAAMMVEAAGDEGRHERRRGGGGGGEGSLSDAASSSSSLLLPSSSSSSSSSLSVASGVVSGGSALPEILLPEI